MLKIARSVCRFAFEIYLVLEWNDRGVKLCLIALTGMIGFAWNCSRLSLRYPSILPWSHFRCYFSCFEKILGKGEDCIFGETPCMQAPEQLNPRKTVWIKQTIYTPLEDSNINSKIWATARKDSVLCHVWRNRPSLKNRNPGIHSNLHGTILRYI